MSVTQPPEKIQITAEAAVRPPRVFVALKMAPETAQALAQYGNDLKRFPVRLVAPADIHLTLVPPWNEASIPQAIERLRRAAGQCVSFTLAFEHIGYGPEARFPRLLWASCAVNDALVALHTALLAEFGQTDERPFRPHVTLVRIRNNGRSIARKCPIDQPLALMQRVESVELMQSPPPGANGYTVLASLPLRAAG
jgi:2'-5' RNA ligase